MADVTIRGAGIFGLSIAWACTLRGARVRLVDPKGAGSGASGGIVGALAPHVPENWNNKKQFQLESLLMAEQFWTGVQDAGGQDPGYARLGRVQPILDARTLDLANARARSADRLWAGSAEWRVVSSGQGWDIPSPTDAYVLDTLSARVHPRKACQALAAALRTRGVEIVAETQDTAPTIWATGYTGFAAIPNRRPVGTGVKGQAALLKYDARTRAQLFIDTIHVVPHGDGTLAIGSTSENQFSDATETDGALDALLDRACASVPELRAASVLQRWAGVRPRARSRAPMLGPWPDKPGHYIANGGFKIGFGMAPKVAEVMADLVLEGQNAVPPDFSVDASR